MNTFYKSNKIVIDLKNEISCKSDLNKLYSNFDNVVEMTEDAYYHFFVGYLKISFITHLSLGKYHMYYI